MGASVEGPRKGPAANRNAGARAASGDFLVFLDDDCIPERDLLAGYARALRLDVAAYEGRITCKAAGDVAADDVSREPHGGTLWSCNFAIRRDVFAALGGFDERFPIAHMEDADLRDRLLRRGIRSCSFPKRASIIRRAGSPGERSSRQCIVRPCST